MLTKARVPGHIEGMDVLWTPGACNNAPFSEGFLEGSRDCCREGSKKGSQKVSCSGF